MLNKKDNITVEYWGELDGDSIYLYTMKNDNGMEVSITNYGGIIRSIKVPNNEKELIDVVLGFDTLEEYLDEHPYFGAIIGRFGNRIANARFKLNNQEYHLLANDGKNHLHGGAKGFDSYVWGAKAIKSGVDTSLILSHLSRDGEEAYPANLDIKVIYTLTNDNEIIINYQAISDEDTIINLTNHSYFNLNGMEDNVLNHDVQLNSTLYTATDEELIPTGAILPVADTPLDFRESKKIGEEIDSDFKPLLYGGGYDHNFVLNANGDVSLAASVFEESTSIMMEVYTDQPGIQLYTGNSLGEIKGKDNKVYTKNYGLCLETQHFPDSINHSHFPSVVLEAGELYDTTTIYKFSNKENK
ncbi:aldose epimerase family protein [Natronospora cellulosivora (SeqCode)]